jgi:hypothetical protein
LRAKLKFALALHLEDGEDADGANRQSLQGFQQHFCLSGDARVWFEAAVMKDFDRTPEYCAACHKANIPASLNEYKCLCAIRLYDEWQRTSHARQLPLPFYKAELPHAARGGRK